MRKGGINVKKILVLCLGLLFLLTAGCGSGKKVDASTPEGVTQAYYQALKDGKFEQAYEYRKFSPPKTKEQFVQERKGSPMPFKEFTIGKAIVTGDQATVPVKFKTGNATMQELTINITLEKDNGWKITSTMSGGGTGNPHGGSAPPAGGSTGLQMPPPGSQTPPPLSGAAQMPPAGK